MPDLQPLVEDANERPAVEIMESFLGRQVRVTTDAERTFSGLLMCIDHFGNLLIFDAVEELQAGNQMHERRLNQIIISLRTVVDAQILVQKHDKVLQIMLEDEMRNIQVK